MKLRFHQPAVCPDVGCDDNQSYPHSSNLLHCTVHCVWSADVKAQENGVGVAVAERPHVVIVRRT